MDIGSSNTPCYCIGKTQFNHNLKKLEFIKSYETYLNYFIDFWDLNERECHWCDRYRIITNEEYMLLKLEIG